MRGLLLGAMGTLLVLGGCRHAEVYSAPVPEPATAPATMSVVPAGTRLEAHLNRTLGTAESRVGDRFTATVEQPVVTGGGAVAIPRGAVLHGVVTGLKRSAYLGDQAAIRLDFTRITWGRRSRPFEAAILRTEVRARPAPELEGAVQGAAAGAAAGAVLGAILGGDLGDMLRGVVFGAGTGTAVSLGTGDVDAVLPAGTDLVLRTVEPIRLR